MILFNPGICTTADSLLTFFNVHVKTKANVKLASFIFKLYFYEASLHEFLFFIDLQSFSWLL